MFPTDFEPRLRRALLSPYESAASLLHEAIAYSLSGEGKLLRPKLVFASAQVSLGIDAPEEVLWARALPAMLAVEMVHCYSLVHDDLPAMDDDDYRRGRLSCHKKFSEAVAILVGDALVADAFEVLSAAPSNALLQIKELSAAIGSSGMALGQHLDLDASAGETDFDAWRRIHQLKTGRLFEASCILGGLSAGASVVTLEKLRVFAHVFGLAFQLRDDLKDNDASVKFLGRERVENLLLEQTNRAKALSSEFGSQALQSLASFL